MQKKNDLQGKERINLIKAIAIDISIALSAFIVSTGICYLLQYFKVDVLNYIIIYILGILLTAVFTKGYIYSALLSVVSVFGYNFFFTVPKYTFHFNDKMYMVTFVLMFAVGIVTSAITFQLKRKMLQINALNLEKTQLKSDAEKEQLKATLLRSISHDLRTPLTTMKNGAEIVLEKQDLSVEDRTEILNDIVAKANWTIRLVENLLSLSRIDNEKLTVKKVPEAVEEIIPQSVRNCKGVLGNRKIHYEMPEEFLLVPMDATLIMQTIGNILINAARHTSENGNIWIKVWNTGRNAVFRISNDGEKIRDEDLPHIFEMYYTVGDCQRGKGVGLGLSICKLVIAAHGGQISARNAEDGKVVFEFTLPMEEKNGRDINS